MPEFRIKKSEISSTNSELSQEWKLRESNKMLSRNWQIISRVISGKKQARQLGLERKYEIEYVTGHGVYFVKLKCLIL